MTIQEGSDPNGVMGPAYVWIRKLDSLSTIVNLRVATNLKDITSRGNLVLHLDNELYSNWINKNSGSGFTEIGNQEIRVTENNCTLTFEMDKDDRHTFWSFF